MGIKRMVDVRAALPQGSENFTLCTHCYEEVTLKIRPETNSFAIMERLKKAIKKKKEMENTKSKYYVVCHLCGFRKWCTMDKNQKPICLACKTYGVNPRFSKDKCR